MKKRNFFKTLSSAVLGALTIGSCSNVWMMEGKRLSAATLPTLGTLAFGYNFNNRMMGKKDEEQKIKNELTSRIVEKIGEETHANVFLRTSFSVQLVDEIMKSKIEMNENTKELICNLAVNGFRKGTKIKNIVDKILWACGAI